jgi:hypothetical protein
VVRAAVLGWRRRPIGGGGGAGRWARVAAEIFFIWKNFLCREPSGLTAHVRREHLRWLSAKSPMPAQRCRVGCAESIQACTERSLLSAQPQIPVVIHLPHYFLKTFYYSLITSSPNSIQLNNHFHYSPHQVLTTFVVQNYYFLFTFLDTSLFAMHLDISMCVYTH